MNTRVVAIDGPAGAGKSTAARRLAERLGALYLDTGAMYRACTLRALRLGVDMDDADALAAVVDGAELQLTTDGKVLLDGEDVSGAIRTPDVTSAIHYLASCPPVRERLVAQQQAIADRAPGWVVAEGRDLGSVVFPQARVKVYLDASVRERATRRFQQLGGAAPPLEQLEDDIATRDRRDTSRQVGPLVRTPDATYLDTSDMTLDQVVDELARIASRC